MKVRPHLVLAALLIGTALLAVSFYLRRTAENASNAEIAKAVIIPTTPEVIREITSDVVVGNGSRFSDLLEQVEIDSQSIARITEVAQSVFDLRRLRRGNRMTVIKNSLGRLESIKYEIDADHELLIRPKGASEFGAVIRDVPSVVKVQAIAGELQGSLFESLMAIGEQPELAVRLAEIFAWDLDFYTDPRPGDVFRVVLEKREYSNGQPPAYGQILMAEYDNAGHPYQAILFHSEDGHPAYYSADGKSLQKAFLRSPLKFAARISSHFSRNRFHPVLKIYRPHLGTDYAAPTGTPVQAIASGSVIVSDMKGGGGNTVEIRHSNGYVSYYMHLSRRLVRSGQRVNQGQRIGLVGMTGLATGPHLDFRLRRNGQFVNFEHMKLPQAGPVPPKLRAEFTTERDRLMPLLVGAVVAKNVTRSSGD